MSAHNTASTFLLGAIAGATLAYGLLKISVDKSTDNSNNNNNNNNTNNNNNVQQGRSISRSNSTPTSPQDNLNGLSDLFQNTSIAFLIPTSNPVIMIEYNSPSDPYRSSIDYALMLMQDNGLVSLPVVDLDKRRYVGMLNVLDIVSYLASHYTFQDSVNQDLASALRTVPVAEVLKSIRDPILPLSASSPLTHLVQVATLADEVPITGNEGQIVSVANRVDVISFVQDNIEILGARADWPIKAFLRGNSSLEIIEPDARVIDALSIMYKTKISELAIVGNTGRLEGNLVSADLRRLSVYNLSRLYEPLSKFVSLNRDSIVWVEPTATLREVIARFLDTKTPVVWIVDNSNSFRPVDSVTLRSIMRLLLDFFWNDVNI